MPEKNVREMSALERRHYSLEARSFRTTVLGAALLGLVALVIGLGLYTYALVGQYVGESFGLARSTAMVVRSVMDVESMTRTVMDTYHSLSEEERAQTGTDGYRERFAAVRENENFEMLNSILREFKNSSDVYDIYLGMYDRENDVLVYIVDPDTEDPCFPGEWESVPDKETEKFYSWDGTSKLYDISNTEKYGWMCTAGVPLTNQAGEIIGFVLADVTLEEVAAGMKNFVIQYTLALSLSVLIYAFFLNRHIKKNMVQPINAIAEAAEAYMSTKNNGGLEKSDLFSSLNIRTGDEIENLSLVMADMEQDLHDYITNLTTVTAEKERIGTELMLATKIQESVLPNSFPAFPELEEFEIYASMDPAKEVGGDFYDFFMVDDDHLAMMTADVSDKGIPAALFMMTSRTMLKDALLAGLDPAGALRRVNSQLTENNSYYMFVTVWIGILEISTGKLIHADAGHEQLIAYHNHQWQLLPRGGGVALGAFDSEMLASEEKPVFVNRELKMDPGDMIFQYTDGVPEAMNSERRQFGMPHLLDTMNEIGELSPTNLLPEIRKRIDAFVQDAPQFDDITMLALRSKGRK